MFAEQLLGMFLAAGLKAERVEKWATISFRPASGINIIHVAHDLTARAHVVESIAQGLEAFGFGSSSAGLFPTLLNLGKMTDWIVLLIGEKE
jgi:hypothetical protein